jgi:DNA-binding NtrC family response regulator
MRVEAARVLLLDDLPVLRAALVRTIRAQGCECRDVGTIAALFLQLVDFEPDLVVVQLNLFGPFVGAGALVAAVVALAWPAVSVLLYSREAPDTGRAAVEAVHLSHRLFRLRQLEKVIGPIARLAAARARAHRDEEEAIVRSRGSISDRPHAVVPAITLVRAALVLQRALVESALEATGGRKRAAARMLGVEWKQFRNLLGVLGLDRRADEETAREVTHEVDVDRVGTRPRVLRRRVADGAEVRGRNGRR